MLRQAEFSSDASVATYLWGRVHQAGELTNSHLAWAYEVALRASEPQRVIDLMEGRLRQDPPLQHGYAQFPLFNGDQFSQNGIFAHLAAAYRAVGRELDAQRAQTEATQRRLSRPRSTTRGGDFF